MSSSGSAADAEVVSGYTLLRELGARVPATYLAKGPGTGTAMKDFVVVERLVRRDGVTADDTASFVRDAKRLVQLRHPNVAAGKNVVVTADEILVVSDLVEGATYADLAQAAKERGEPIPLTTTLRILIDVLQGLSALHDRRDPGGAVAGMVHGCVAPMNVIVGHDGTARLIGVSRAPASAGSPAADAVGYLAPEVLLADASADGRADVFGVGVILWETLSGTRMHTDPSAGSIVLRLLGGKIERPRAPLDAPWAEPVIDAAMRAIAPDPSARFPTAAAFTGELRRAVGAKLASKSAVAQTVEALCGTRIRARRSALMPAPRPLKGAPAAPRRADIPTPIVAMTIPTDDAVEIIEIDLAPDPSDAKIAAPAPTAPRLVTEAARPTAAPLRPPLASPSVKPSIPRAPEPSVPEIAPPPAFRSIASITSSAPGTLGTFGESAPMTSAAPAPIAPIPPERAPSPLVAESERFAVRPLASPPPVGATTTRDPLDSVTPIERPRRRRAIAIGLGMLLIAAIAIFAVRSATREAHRRGPIAPAPAPTETMQARSGAIEQEAIPHAEPTEPTAAAPTEAHTESPTEAAHTEGVDVASSPAPAPSARPVGESPSTAPSTPPEPAGTTKPKKTRYDPMGI